MTEPQRTVLDEPPPFLGTWRRVYTVVVIYLACVISIFYWFNQSFAPSLIS